MKRDDEIYYQNNLKNDLDWQARAQHTVDHMLERLDSAQKELMRAKKSVRQAKQCLIPRGKDESPVQYFKRTGCVDDNYTRVYKGLYYCNPAHCKHSWEDKKKRDAHLCAAYGILG
jgi:hypothetical protein